MLSDDEGARKGIPQRFEYIMPEPDEVAGRSVQQLRDVLDALRREMESSVPDQTRLAAILIEWHESWKRGDAE